MFSNTIKTTLLLGLMTALIILIGGAVGGQHGMVIAFFLAGSHEPGELLVFR